MCEGTRTARARNGFEVVRASPKHVGPAALLFDAYRQFYGRPSDPEGARAFLSERMTREESVLYLALGGPEALGFVQLYPSFSSVSMKPLWILNDLFVAPEARGRGVGTALLAEATRLAKNTGARGLELATATDNLTAQRLYEGLGWKRDHAFHHYYLDVQGR